jgi:phosphosulfolactate synthase
MSSADAPLALPERPAKPRSRGLTMVIDSGLPTRYFEDAIESAGDLIDLVKFGWGTSLVTRDLDRKISCLRGAGVDHCFGGTLFEKFVARNRVEDYIRFCQRHGCRCVEISNGTIDLSNDDKARYISLFKPDFRVLSEVGYKDSGRSLELPPVRWIQYIRQDLEAGADLVIAEARESGRSGICRADGEPRYGLIEEILESGLELDRVLFEAPNKDLQTYFIRRVGPNVNLGNVAADDVIGLETLRLGLRSDTLLNWD